VRDVELMSTRRTVLFLHSFRCFGTCTKPGKWATFADRNRFGNDLLVVSSAA